MRGLESIETKLKENPDIVVIDVKHFNIEERTWVLNHKEYDYHIVRILATSSKEELCTPEKLKKFMKEIKNKTGIKPEYMNNPSEYAGHMGYGGISFGERKGKKKETVYIIPVPNMRIGELTSKGELSRDGISLDDLKRYS